MRIEVYEEFFELLRASDPKKGELVYATQRSKKDGNLILITSASLEVPEVPEGTEGTEEIKADTYDFVLTFNSWFEDDETLRRSEALLALLKKKKGLSVKPEDMAERRKLRNLEDKDNLQKMKRLKKFKKA